MADVKLPCIEKLLGSEKFGEAGAEILASYIKSYVDNYQEALELAIEYAKKEGLGLDTLSRLPKLIERASDFTCELVRNKINSICNEEMQSVCPLYSDSAYTKVLARTRSVKVFKNKYIVVEFADGKTFEERLDKLMTARGINMRSFKSWWAANYKEVLEFLKTKEEDEAYELFTEWLKMAEHVDVPDEVDEAKDFLVDLFAHYKIHKKPGIRNVYYDNKLVYVPNTLIKSFLDITNAEFSPRKLRVLLDDIVAGNVSVEWIDGRPVRVWRFFREGVERLLEKKGIKFEDLIVDERDMFEIA